MSEEQRLKLILTEYEQTGEEYRSRHQLLHNSYYLFIISLLLFGGAAIPLSDDPHKLGLLFVLGSVASFVLGFAILTHFLERRSAAALRTRTEQAIEEITNEGVEHDLDIQRPLAIQYYVIGQNADMDDSNDLVVREDDYDVVWTKPDLSAKTLGQGVLVLSILQAVIGIGLIISVPY